MNNNDEEKVLNTQLVATALYILSLVISIILTYNEKLKITNKKIILNNNEENILSVANRTFAVILSLVFLYIAYQNRIIAEQKKEPIGSYILQITASEITTLAAIIALYIIIKSQGENYTVIANIENPTL